MSNQRQPNASVDDQFIERWSPRAFETRAVSKEDIASLFEAARWAPSCFNDQPWLYLYEAEGASTPEELERFRSLLMDGNRVWADRAPVLAFVLARRHFEHNGKENRTHAFDAGLATMSLMLQAHKLGLHAHAMAGIHLERVYEELEVPEDQYEVICAVALGYRDRPEILPQDLQKREVLSGRKAPGEVAARGAFSKT